RGGRAPRSAGADRGVEPAADGAPGRRRQVRPERLTAPTRHVQSQGQGPGRELRGRHLGAGSVSRDDLDRLLPPDPGVDPVRHVPYVIPASLPRHLAERVAELPVPNQRSEQTCGLVIAAVEWGLSDAEVLGLAYDHAPTVEKYGK